MQQFTQQVASQVPPKEDMPTGGAVTVTVKWLVCQNTECRQILVQINRNEQIYGGTGRQPKSESWIALPKKKAPPQVSVQVPDPSRSDYIEADTILEDSPRMSSVLSRRILADLLKQYAKIDNPNLVSQVDAFVKDLHHPSRLRENLHYLREMGNFGAHTQVDDEQQIINVSLEEAQFTLKVIGDLFDYFIVAPKRDELIRAEFDKKLDAAGRKAIPRLSDPVRE